MGAWRAYTLLGLAAGLLASPVAAQDISERVVVRGRAEDAVSRTPIDGARVIAVDSSVATLTDSSGAFAIPLLPDGPLAVIVEQFGYVSQRFDLDATAVSRGAVLLLAPAPVEIEGVTVEEEAAMTSLQRALERRRNSYPYRVLALDRTTLERYRSASVLDVVRTRAPQIAPCREDPAQICLPGRSSAIDDLDPQSPVGVCVDGLRAPLARPELEALSIEAVALLELYLGPEERFTAPHLRIYTGPWMVRQARAGRTTVVSLWMGCS